MFYRLKPQLLSLAKNKTLKGHEYTTVLAGIVFAGWKTVDGTTGERYVTNSEMRDVLVMADDEFRSNILWHLERNSEAQAESENWAEQLSLFLEKVWPRQKSVKTPRMTAKLCNLAFSASSFFPEIVDAILPLVTKIDDATRHELLRVKDETVSQHPEKVLALLSVILPENASIWPYGIENALETIGVSEPSLLNDARLIELKRRWSSR